MRLHAKWMFVLAMALYVRFGVPAAAAVPSGGWCGDGICETGTCDQDESPGDGCRETRNNCPDDCWDKCGDGQCQVAVEADCNDLDLWCTDDCGDTIYDTCGECVSSDDCPSGDTCTMWHDCVATSPQEPEPPSSPECGGECQTNDDCCGSDVCYGNDGTSETGYCAPPQQAWCPDSFQCDSSYDCYHSWCDVYCVIPCKDMYCDPGIGRCQFVSGTDCPGPSNICQ
jgi:hypothetical protein